MLIGSVRRLAVASQVVPRLSEMLFMDAGDDTLTSQEVAVSKLDEGVSVSRELILTSQEIFVTSHEIVLA